MHLARWRLWLQVSPGQLHPTSMLISQRIFTSKRSSLTSALKKRHDAPCQSWKTYCTGLSVLWNGEIMGLAFDMFWKSKHMQQITDVSWVMMYRRYRYCGRSILREQFETGVGNVVHKWGPSWCARILKLTGAIVWSTFASHTVVVLIAFRCIHVPQSP